MVSKNLIIINSVGLHLRPAGVFAAEMMKFDSKVTIIFEDKIINAKSMLGIISAGIKCGSEILVECEGSDEEQALRRAEELILGGFNDT